MKRPNKLDWLIYRIFRWWWNPILEKKPILVIGIVKELEKWLHTNGISKTDWENNSDSETCKRD